MIASSKQDTSFVFSSISWDQDYTQKESSGA